MATLNFHPGGYRDAHDQRDLRFSPSIGHVPPKVDLSRFCGAAYDQYRTQSCSANALASALTLDANQRDVPLAPPSRLFMYYNARAQTNSQATDSGTTIRNAIKAYAREGACAERQWPFVKRDITKRPMKACYRDAGALPVAYYRIQQRVDDLRAALAQGRAFIFGIAAYGQPFTEAAKSGTLRLPKKTDTLCGGHALIAVGYDTAKKRFLARNSLGRNYARDGFFWIPDTYFRDPELTYDFWVVGGVGGGGKTG
jgi:C1A family cysteine protease